MWCAFNIELQDNERNLQNILQSPTHIYNNRIDILPPFLSDVHVTVSYLFPQYIMKRFSHGHVRLFFQELSFRLAMRIFISTLFSRKIITCPTFSNFMLTFIEYICGRMNGITLPSVLNALIGGWNKNLSWYESSSCSQSIRLRFERNAIAMSKKKVILWKWKRFMA